MPDGANLDPSELACATMHGRLICWGRLELRGGSGPRERWDSDSTREYFAYGPKEYTDAEEMSGKVWQLPKPQQRLVLQEFYVDDDLATQWETFTWYRKETVILPGLARNINNRLRREVNSVLAEWARFPEVRPGDIDGIRLRAIRLLVNREELAKAALEKLREATYQASK